jgi:hypothetical protein
MFFTGSCAGRAGNHPPGALECSQQRTEIGAGTDGPIQKSGPSPRTIDDLRTFMSQIRKKIEDDPSNPKYLLTDAYLGYRFCEAH